MPATREKGSGTSQARPADSQMQLNEWAQQMPREAEESPHWVQSTHEIVRNNTFLF